MANQRANYVYGNTARHYGDVSQYGYSTGQAQRAPRREYEPNQRPDQRPERVHKQKTRAKTTYKTMQAQYAKNLIAAMLVLAVCAGVYICGYASITSRSTEVTAMQREISSLKLENDAALGAIEDSVNLDEVKQRATELGMVYMNNNQVLEYESPTQDYVKQYEDIPKNGVITSTRAASEQR